MKTKLLISLTAALLFLMPNSNFGQTINLGTAADFVLFSTNGSVSNTGYSNLTGNVGTNLGSSTAFGNVNGVMHDNDKASATAKTDLLEAYTELNTATPTFHPASVLGNNVTLVPGVYSISGISSLNSVLTLDGQGDPNAIFIFQLDGAFSTNAESKVKLINEALACNVFWKVEGQVSMATGTSMKGTIIANNAAINMATRSTLEGRALSIAGAITTNAVTAQTPTGCGSVVLLGPVPPALASLPNFSIFSSNGTISNSGVSKILGDVGTNVGLTTGFEAQNVTGTIHPIPDWATNATAADLINVYVYLHYLPVDINLLYPAQFGHNLVLTPHTYKLNTHTTLTDTLYLNAQGNADAVFVINIQGFLSTSIGSRVLLINGAQSKNVYWKIDGYVDINSLTSFKGIIIVNNGQITFGKGVTLDGKAYTTSGAISTNSITTTMAYDGSSILTDLAPVVGVNNTLTIAPNPFKSNTNIILNDPSDVKNYKLIIYNAMGIAVINTIVSKQVSSIDTSDLNSGIYFYKVLDNDKTIQSGKLISQQ